jgi:hypothetical protein
LAEKKLSGMALGCPIPSCLASGGKMIKVKDIHAAKTQKCMCPGTGM